MQKEGGFQLDKEEEQRVFSSLTGGVGGVRTIHYSPGHNTLVNELPNDIRLRIL